MTNGGGNLEKVKTQKMNQTFGEELFSEDLMFMSHSPMRPLLRKYSSQGGVLLITGSLNITDIVNDMGITNYVTADELHTIFHGPHEFLQEHFHLTFNVSKEEAEKVEARIKKRLGWDSLPHTYNEWGDIIKAIFALNDVNPYEKALEVIHNVYQERTKRGLPLPPYHAGHNDIAFAGNYHRPRMAFGPFNYMLDHHCSRHNFQYPKHYFGKPGKAVFEYVQDVLVNKFGDGCFFMFGDNPRADIKGANEIGWASFLTQTGVH